MATVAPAKRVSIGFDLILTRRWRQATRQNLQQLLIERFERAEQLVRRGGEVADARAGCVVDGVDDRRACAADAELAKSLATERAAVRVGLLEKHRLDRADIGVHPDVIARQILGDERAE